MSAVMAGIGQHLSLLSGWVPIVVQVVAAVTLALAIDWPTRRRRLLAAAVAAGAGVAMASIALRVTGGAGTPMPPDLWLWLAATPAAAVLVCARRRGVRWWRRLAKLVAVPACVLCVALAINTWTGYLPTVGTAWNQLTAGPLPDQADSAAVALLVAHHTSPATGKVLPLVTGQAVSGFHHRDELVYLPPAWFRSSPPPALPVVMMIGGEFNTPADWIRTGNAVTVADSYAAHHHGVAPILVFVDPGGTFANDTECVDGPRGNAAEHLVKEVVPTVDARFTPAGHTARWAVAGWSMGGTCAVDLAVMHPDIFSAFVDMAGDIAPNSGTLPGTHRLVRRQRRRARPSRRPAPLRRPARRRHHPVRRRENSRCRLRGAHPARPSRLAVCGVRLCRGIRLARGSDRPANHRFLTDRGGTVRPCRTTLSLTR
jgi:S-formylglutathione hydrolase FrmB